MTADLSSNPLIRRPDFLPSPEKTFDLPVYAEHLAQSLQLLETDSNLSYRHRIDPRVLKFLDVEAYSSGAESDSDSSSGV